MWAIAGILLGLVLLASIVGFHTGPHSHIAAGVLGAIAAFWLVVMALAGQAAPSLFALLGADIVLTAGIGTVAYKGLQSERELAKNPQPGIEGQLGTALTALAPDGTVRVQGETWSATALNPPIAEGTPVQVVDHVGVRLTVWGAGGELTSPSHDPKAFELDSSDDPIITNGPADAGPQD